MTTAEQNGVSVLDNLDPEMPRFLGGVGDGPDGLVPGVPVEPRGAQGDRGEPAGRAVSAAPT